MADQEDNGNDLEVKNPNNLSAKLFDYLAQEISMRKRIASRTNLYCEYEGTYYNDQNPSQTLYMKVGDRFPPVLIHPQGGRSGGHQIGPVTWVVCEEDRPRKSWRDFGHVYLLIVSLALAILLIRFASTVPLF